MADCGVYKITNTVTGDFYIGSSCNLQRRIRAHCCKLANGEHENCHLQRAWNKYSEQAFEFNVVLLCDVEHKLYFEQKFLDLLKPTYNIAISAQANMQGVHPSEETRRKLSEALKGRLTSEETRCKLGKASKGRRHTAEAKRKISEASKGRRPSIETRKKMSDALKGHPRTEETKRKISEATKGALSYMFGQRHSDETKQKMSASQSGELHPNFGKHLSEETRRKISEAKKGNTVCFGRKYTDETKRKMSESHKRRFAEVSNG